MTGSNKKMNYPILKAIRITENQDKNWNVDNIRNYLNDNKTVDTSLLKKLYDLMGNKMIFTQAPTEEDIELIKLVKEMIK